MPGVGMTNERLFTGAAFEREYGYCRAIRAGSFVFVSGTTPSDDALDAGMATQFASAAKRVERSLAEFGASMADVVRSVVYVRDMSEIDAICAAHAAAFGAHPPASTVVEVTALTPPEAMVEIEVTAVIAEGQSAEALV